VRTAALTLACGIDPQRSTRLSSKQVALPTATHLVAQLPERVLNWLERMIQFKEKAIKPGRQRSRWGCSIYPVLMAATSFSMTADP